MLTTGRQTRHAVVSEKRSSSRSLMVRWSLIACRKAGLEFAKRLMYYSANAIVVRPPQSFRYMLDSPVVPGSFVRPVVVVAVFFAGSATLPNLSLLPDTKAKRNNIFFSSLSSYLLSLVRLWPSLPVATPLAISGRH